MRTDLATVARLARRELDGFWATLDHSNMIQGRQALEEFFPILIEEYGNIAAVVAADWYEDVYEEYSFLTSRTVNPDQVNSRMRWAIGKAFKNEPDVALGTLGVVTDELVKQFGRDTVIESAQSNRRSYARIPTGAETCAFCLMLASRGFVYHSQRTAGETSKFHGDCDCVIAPSDGEVPEGYDPDDLYEKYLNAHDPGDTAKETLRKLRQEQSLAH